MHPSRYRPDVFLQLKQSALSLARKTAPYAALPSTQPSIPEPNGPVLPLPKPLVHQLKSLGVDETSAHRISLSLTHAASNLKELCEKEFQRWLKTSPPCFNDSQSVSRIPSVLTAVYTRAIREWTSYLLDDVAPRVLHLQSQRRTTRPLGERDSKVPFNHNATPALEASFEDNAFPSRLEKHELAAKWGMRYRQVDVWFQNRRRRFKNQGKDLKQRPVSNPLLQNLEQTVVDCLLPLLPEDEEVGPGQSDGENDIPSFNLEPAAHAFPGPWPPLCSYDPFPITPGERIFETSWLRSPNSTLPLPKPIDLAVEELILIFGNLTISEDLEVETRGSPSRRCGAPPSSVPYIGFTTHCLRAPLPALNSPRRTLRSRHVTGCSSVPQALMPADKNQRKTLSGSNCQRFRNGSLQRPPQSSPPESQSPQIPASIAPSRRIKRSLPKRYPKNPPLRSGPEGTISTMRSGIVVSASTSSTGSLSSNSPSSDTDSPLSTPQLLSISLPDPIVFDMCQSWIGYPHTQSPIDILDSGLSLPKTYPPIPSHFSKLPDDSSISLYVSPSPSVSQP